MIRPLMFVALLIKISSCQDYDSPIYVKKTGITLTLPGFVNEDELSEDAFIEYANRYRNFYIVGIQLNAQLGTDSLWKLSTDRITNQLNDFKIDTNHVSNSIISYIRGQCEGEKEAIYYSQKLVLKNSKAFVLTVWTRGSERYKKYNSLISEILFSAKVQDSF